MRYIKPVYALLAILMVTTLIACEKEVKINLSTGGSQVVVNGVIETGQPPLLALTRSIGYFAKIDLATLENSFVHNARVTVSDGTREITLREYSIDTSNTATGSLNKFYFYSIDTATPGAFSFVGEVGKFYKLTITVDGKTYESTTKIPNCKPVDSIVTQIPNVPAEKAPTALLLSVYYSDPDTPGNCIRYFTKRNSEPYYPGFNSVYDDQIVNGVKSALLPILAGYDRSTAIINDSTGKVFPGDTLTLKWCAIDRGVYNFYNTYEYSLGTVGNPFASPINVKSNVSGGALGIWAGYGSTYATKIIPK
jgi:hypothetical protein